LQSALNSAITSSSQATRFFFAPGRPPVFQRILSDSNNRIRTSVLDVPKNEEIGEMGHSHLLLISSVLVSAPMKLLREFTGNYQCRNSGAEYLTVIATVLVQNACSKKIHKGTPRTLECGAYRNQDPFSLFGARGILSELTGICQCRNSGAEYLTANATVLVQDVCSKKFSQEFPGTR